MAKVKLSIITAAWNKFRHAKGYFTKRQYKIFMGKDSEKRDKLFFEIGFTEAKKRRPHGKA